MAGAACALFPLFAMSATPVPAKGEIALVRDRQPVATIVVAADASAEVRQAAERLAALIHEATGARLPLAASAGEGAALYIGAHADLPAPPEGMDADGFLLHPVGANGLAILGGGDRGTTHGVAHFLEHYLGVRWLMPGPLGVDVPQSTSLSIPLAPHREEPAFLSRSLGPLEYGDPAAQEWGILNRLHRRVSSAHGMRQLFPVTQFGESHPEFYPLFEGKRLIPPPGPRFKGDRAHYLWQPNFTAPGIVETAVQQIDRFFQENPHKESYPLGLNDGNNRFDQSEASLKRRSGRKNSMRYDDVSDDYFLFANDIAGKVSEKYPAKWLGTLAYREITDPPSAEIGVHPRIVPFLTQDRLRWIDERLKTDDQKRTSQWAAQAKALGWYDYQYGASYQVPRIYPHTMGEALQWASANGVRFYVAELYPNWAEGPKPWLLARLLWNPGQEVGPLLEEWYTRAVGPEAAPKLAAFYQLWETFWTQNILKSPWWHDRGPYLSYYDRRYLAAVPTEWIAQCDTLLEEALALADTEPRKARATFLREMWQDWYRPNLVLYQAEHLPPPPLTNGDEALAEVARVSNVIATAETFRQTLEGWGKDRAPGFQPFYSEPEVKNTSTITWEVRDRLKAFNFDGTTLLWRLRPWVAKEPRVAAELERLAANGSPAVRETARIVLASAAGNGRQTVANPSFEAEINPWKVEEQVSAFPSDYPFNDKAGSPQEAVVISSEKAHTGASSLHLRARREPGKTDVVQSISISQEIPYQAGSTYAQLFCYAEKSAPKTVGQLTFEAVDANGKALATKFPSSALAVGNGDWRENIQSLQLPELPAAARLRVTATFRMLTPLGDFDVRQQLYLDDFSLYALEAK